MRYKKNAIKRKLLEIKQKEALEQAEIRQRFKNFQLSDNQKQRLKVKVELEESRRYKKELQAEFRERKIQDKKVLANLSREEKARAKQARLLEKKERKKLFRDNARIQFRNFFLSFRSFNILTIRQKIMAYRENAPNRRRFVIISFNSTAFYLLAYLGLFLLSQAITVIAASFFNYPTIVHYYEIYFNIGPDSWYHDSVRTIFSAGPLFNFVIGITFLIIYSNVRELAGPFKLFFLWGFLHAANMLFGAMMVGTLFETGVGHVISWMYIMDTGKVLYSILSIFLLVIAGLLATRHFLISGNTYFNEINRANRTSFIIAQVLMPYLLGNLFLILLRQPRFIFYDSFIGLTLIICILPVLATYRSYNELYFEEGEKKPIIAWRALIILIVVILFYRGVLEIGLRFGN